MCPRLISFRHLSSCASDQRYLSRQFLVLHNSSFRLDISRGAFFFPPNSLDPKTRKIRFPSKLFSNSTSLATPTRIYLILLSRISRKKIRKYSIKTSSRRITTHILLIYNKKGKIGEFISLIRISRNILSKYFFIKASKIEIGVTLHRLK